MSKGDGDRDETPIQFYIPRISSRGRAPVPLNQPRWKYAPDYATPPGVGDWLFSALFTVMATTVIFLAVTELDNFPKVLFIVIGVIFIFFSTQMTVMRLWKYRKFMKSVRKNETREKPEKKQPKRRKDYR
jgi:hypothetical protein